MKRPLWRSFLLLTWLACPIAVHSQFEVPTRAPQDAPAIVTMVEPGEPGQPLLVRGLIADAAAKPVAAVSVFAFQTDARGIYSEVGNRRPRIRGYARSDAEGRFELETIRPASYPDSRVQQHIHFRLSRDGSETTETEGEIVFDDDPLLSDRARRDPDFVVCQPEKRDGASELCEVTLRLR